MKIDFVSDVSCPFCVLGLGGLEEALQRVGDLIQAEIHFQPFELNPDMPREGQKFAEHVAQKYGARPSAEQSAANRAAMRARAAEQRWIAAGVRSVPTVVINDRYLISGGQPVAAFEKALRSIAAEA
jgi:predicted DsbA family dithiol-disulfide isomerase